MDIVCVEDDKEVLDYLYKGNGNKDKATLDIRIINHINHANLYITQIMNFNNFWN